MYQGIRRPNASRGFLRNQGMSKLLTTSLPQIAGAVCEGPAFQRAKDVQVSVHYLSVRMDLSRPRLFISYITHLGVPSGGTSKRLFVCSEANWEVTDGRCHVIDLQLLHGSFIPVLFGLHVKFLFFQCCPEFLVMFCLVFDFASSQNWPTWILVTRTRSSHCSGCSMTACRTALQTSN